MSVNETIFDTTLGSILIIDDDHRNQRQLSDILTSHGYTVECLSEVRHLDRKVQSIMPDVILISAHLADGSDRQICRMIKDKESTQHIPVLCMCRPEMLHDRLRIYQDCYSDYILLPFLKDEVLVRIHTQRAFQRLKRQKKSKGTLTEIVSNEIEKQVSERTAGLKKAYDALEKHIIKRNQLLEEQTHELTKAKEAAEAATYARSLFLANMSHEIRTPMNAIIGFVNLVFKTEMSAEQKGFLHKIRSASRNLLEIVNDILDFSKIEAGTLSIEKKPFRLQDILNDLSDMFADQVTKKGFEMNIGVDSDVPNDLIGDPFRISQCLINLTSNAIKFTQTGDIFIFVSLVEEQGSTVHLAFMVKDTGIGIAANEIEALFLPFIQADGTTTRKYGGTGLGLAICKKIIDLLGGEIGVDSRLNEGSTFTFTIPLEVQGLAGKPVRNYNYTKGKKALVVDDNESSRKVHEAMLASFGLKTTALGGAITAVEELNRAAVAGKPYWLVLMDYNMPELDGLEAAKMIHQNPKTQDVPIVLISGFVREEVKLEAARVGIKSFLQKPIKKTELFEVVIEVTGGVNLSSTIKRGRAIAERSSGALHLRGARVLLVEDMPINQEVTMKLLQEAGIDVVAVENGEQALKAIWQSAFEAVLMDIQMPVMNGLEATRWMRKDPRFDKLPIIAMTAHVMDDELEKCLAAGMNDFISKPVDPDQLFSVLAKWLTPKPLTGLKENPPPSPEVADDTAFPSIAGVDVNAGLKRINGDRFLYAKLLIEFAAKSAKLVSRIEAAAERSDRLQAGQNSHALKGLAGNLGAFDVFSAAHSLELCYMDMVSEAASSNAPCKKEFLRLSDAVHRLVGAIQFLESAKKNFKKGERQTWSLDHDLSQAQAILDQLDDLLAASRTQATDLIEPVERLLSMWNIGEDADRLFAQIDAYDFENARNTLKQIRTEIQV